MPEILRNTLDILLETAPWLLLGLAMAGLIRAWLPQDRVARWLGGRGIWPVARAAVVGAPLPLCSCGVVPTALGLYRSGADRAATTSFLIATPETGADSMALSWVLLGPFMMIARPVAAVVSGVVTGLGVSLVRGRPRPGQARAVRGDASRCDSGGADACCSQGSGTGPSRPARDRAEARGDACCAPVTGVTAETRRHDPAERSWRATDTRAAPGESACGGTAPADACCGGGPATTVVAVGGAPADDRCCPGEAAGAGKACCGQDGPANADDPFWRRTWSGLHYAATDILDDISVYLVLGLVIAGLTVSLVPPTALAQWGSGPLAMAAVFVLGIPMYVCATESTPIAAAMLFAGLSPGTVLVFLLAGPSTNLGTLGALRREFGTAWLGVYLAGIAVSTLGIGLLTDALVSGLHIPVAAQLGGAALLVPTWLAALCAAVLVLLGVRPVRRVLPGFRARAA